MKFLVIIEGVSGTLPPEKFLAINKANWVWAKGKVQVGEGEAYALADHAGSLMGDCGIVNVNSLEELAESLGVFPGASGATIKVYPLVAPEVADNRIAQVEASLAKK